MLAQFQARYPTGSLISELVTIYQGKFVVRVSATVEGVVRATGMAASETLELAEDQARSRALMVLGIQGATSAQSVASAPQTAANQVQMQPVETAFSPPAVSPGLQGLKSDRFPLTKSTQLPEPPSGRTLTPTPDQEPDVPIDNFGMMSDTQTESRSNPPIPFGNVTPLVPRSYSAYESSGSPSETDAETQMRVSEPIDLSDAIARTSVELRRLKWSNQQGREYLLRTYSKRSRQELTDEEMLEFLHYLENQPSP